MAIIALKAWYLRQYEPIKELSKRPHDLRLSKNSLLKSGLRADFLDDRHDVENSEWFLRYLEGETVEFYIEGSGGYAISNIDSVSQEIYFTKLEVMAQLEPIIFFSQSEYNTSTQSLRTALSETIASFNQRSRLPLTLEESLRKAGEPLRLSSTQMRKIRKCLLFVADGTPVTGIQQEENAYLLPSPTVCIELGYALSAKRTEQILLSKMERPDLSGQFPFNLPNYQQLVFNSPRELKSSLPTIMEALLQRFHLFT